MSEYALRLSEEELARYRFMADAALRSEGALWARAGIVEGAKVADIGCGPGAVSVVLSRLVGGSGEVWGVDREPGTVETARAEVESGGCANVHLSVGDAHASGLPAASFDTVMIRHVLAHNGGREQAIVDHAASLVRPGGHLYLVDIDASAIRTRPVDPDVEDLAQRYYEWHARQGNDLSVGLRLGELLRDAHLEVVEYQGRYEIVTPPPGFRPPAWAARDAMIAAGLATPQDVARWLAAFERIDKSPEPFTVFAPLFFGIGRKPADRPAP